MITTGTEINRTKTTMKAAMDKAKERKQRVDWSQNEWARVVKEMDAKKDEPRFRNMQIGALLRTFQRLVLPPDRWRSDNSFSGKPFQDTIEDKLRSAREALSFVKQYGHPEEPKPPAPQVPKTMQAYVPRTEEEPVAAPPPVVAFRAQAGISTMAAPAPTPGAIGAVGPAPWPLAALPPAPFALQFDAQAFANAVAPVLLPMLRGMVREEVSAALAEGKAPSYEEFQVKFDQLAAYAKSLIDNKVEPAPVAAAPAPVPKPAEPEESKRVIGVCGLLPPGKLKLQAMEKHLKNVRINYYDADKIAARESFPPDVVCGSVLGHAATNTLRERKVRVHYVPTARPETVFMKIIEVLATKDKE